MKPSNSESTSISAALQELASMPRAIKTAPEGESLARLVNQFITDAASRPANDSLRYGEWFDEHAAMVRSSDPNAFYKVSRIIIHYNPAKAALSALLQQGQDVVMAEHVEVLPNAETEKARSANLLAAITGAHDQDAEVRAQYSPLDPAAYIEGAVGYLHDCANLFKVKSALAAAQAVSSYVRGIRAAQGIQNAAEEVRLHSQRRLGELLRGLQKAPPGPKGIMSRHATYLMEGKVATLRELKITRQEASKAEKAASVPKPVLDNYFANARAAGKAPTLNGVLRLATIPAKARPAPSSAESSLKAFIQRLKALADEADLLINDGNPVLAKHLKLVTTIGRQLREASSALEPLSTTALGSRAAARPKGMAARPGTRATRRPRQQRKARRAA